MIIASWLASSGCRPSFPRQTWAATSRTATSITGDIALAHDRITIANANFPLLLVHEIDTQHLEDAGKIVDLPQPAASARLYKTLISRHATLLNGNTICGPGNDAKWMLAVYAKDQMSLAFFSGAREPNLDYQVVSNGHDLCGTFAYATPSR